ncbi:MAG TPA: hypothetical protein VGR15_11070, partial [Bacteroidota bacterium]|nr:hypothetical protein [Bacteroidota bacterium]
MKTANRLCAIPNGSRWLLILTTKNPGCEDWKIGVKSFNDKFQKLQVTSINDPADFPDFIFAGF